MDPTQQLPHSSPLALSRLHSFVTRGVLSRRRSALPPSRSFLESSGFQTPKRSYAECNGMCAHRQCDAQRSAQRIRRRLMKDRPSTHTKRPVPVNEILDNCPLTGNVRRFTCCPTFIRITRLLEGMKSKRKRRRYNAGDHSYVT